jgi:hypothetical protein
MTKVLSGATLLFILTSSLAAQTLENRTQTLEKTKNFIAETVAGNVQKAYQSLRPYLGVSAAPYDHSAKEAVTYFQQVTEKVGKPIGSSHVKTETIANDFTREIWLQKFEAAAIAWRFTFYQPDNKGWKLVGISYSTDMSDLYQTKE